MTATPIANRVPKSSTSRWIFWLIVIGTFLLFSPVVFGEFLHWDDDYNISSNPHLEGGFSWAQIKWCFFGTKYFFRYQPLCWLVWSLLRDTFGRDPLPFHMIVLLFHAVNSGLVFLLVRKILLLAFRKQVEKPAFNADTCAALAAIFWAINPMRAETTAWAVELVFVQPVFFFLLSLLSYLQWVESPGERRFYFHALIFYLLSLASYPLALGGCVVYLMLDIFFQIKTEGDFDLIGVFKKRVSSNAPFFAVAFAFGALNLVVRSHADPAIFPSASFAHFGIGHLASQATFIWAYYVWRPWLPFNLTPVPMMLTDFSPRSWPFLFSSIAVVAITIVLFIARKRAPGWLLIWLCHLAILVPVTGITEHPHYPSDRYSLLDGIGWVVLLGFGFSRWNAKKRRQTIVTAYSVFLLLLAMLTLQQIPRWHDDDAFLKPLYQQLARREKVTTIELTVAIRYLTTLKNEGKTAEAIKLLPVIAERSRAFAIDQKQRGKRLMAEGDFSDASDCFKDAQMYGPPDRELDDLIARTASAKTKQ